MIFTLLNVMDELFQCKNTTQVLKRSKIFSSWLCQKEVILLIPQKAQGIYVGNENSIFDLFDFYFWDLIHHFIVSKY